MKTISEWQMSQTEYEDQEVFIENMSELAEALKISLKSYHGDRFDAFLDIIGICNETDRAIADVHHGTVQERNQWTNKLQQWKIEQLEKINLSENSELANWAKQFCEIVEQFQKEQMRYKGEKFPGYSEIVEGIDNLSLILTMIGLSS